MTLPSSKDFLEQLKLNGYSTETIYNYERDLNTFDGYLECEHQIISFSKITKEIIEQFVIYLSSSDRKTAHGEKAKVALNNRSINRIITSLRRYFSYLIEMNFPVSVLPESIKLVYVNKLRRSQVSEYEELTKLTESPSIFEKNKIVALRNRAMLETLFASGMRISELINLWRIQLDATDRTTWLRYLLS